MIRGRDESEIESRRERIMVSVTMVLSQLRWLRTYTYIIYETRTPQLARVW